MEIDDAAFDREQARHDRECHDFLDRQDECIVCDTMLDGYRHAQEAPDS